MFFIGEISFILFKPKYISFIFKNLIFLNGVKSDILLYCKFKKIKFLKTSSAKGDKSDILQNYKFNSLNLIKSALLISFNILLSPLDSVLSSYYKN